MMLRAVMDISWLPFSKMTGQLVVNLTTSEICGKEIFRYGT